MEKVKLYRLMQTEAYEMGGEGEYYDFEPYYSGSPHYKGETLDECEYLKWFNVVSYEEAVYGRDVSLLGGWRPREILNFSDLYNAVSYSCSYDAKQRAAGCVRDEYGNYKQASQIPQKSASEWMTEFAAEIEAAASGERETWEVAKHLRIKVDDEFASGKYCLIKLFAGCWMDRMSAMPIDGDKWLVSCLDGDKTVSVAVTNGYLTKIVAPIVAHMKNDWERNAADESLTVRHTCPTCGREWSRECYSRHNKRHHAKHSRCDRCGYVALYNPVIDDDDVPM